jgi:hypothetical protein
LRPDVVAFVPGVPYQAAPVEPALSIKDGESCDDKVAPLVYYVVHPSIYVLLPMYFAS